MLQKPPGKEIRSVLRGDGIRKPLLDFPCCFSAAQHHPNPLEKLHTAPSKTSLTTPGVPVLSQLPDSFFGVDSQHHFPPHTHFSSHHNSSQQDSCMMDCAPQKSRLGALTTLEHSKPATRFSHKCWSWSSRNCYPAPARGSDLLQILPLPFSSAQEIQITACAVAEHCEGRITSAASSIPGQDRGCSWSHNNELHTKAPIPGQLQGAFTPRNEMAPWLWKRFTPYFTRPNKVEERDVSIKGSHKNLNGCLLQKKPCNSKAVAEHTHLSCFNKAGKRNEALKEYSRKIFEHHVYHRETW